MVFNEVKLSEKKAHDPIINKYVDIVLSCKPVKVVGVVQFEAIVCHQ